MSLESWKKEFYPVSASCCPKSKAIEHSLQKWLGLRSKALAKHDLEIDNDSLSAIVERGSSWFDNVYLGIDGYTCALCHHHLEHTPNLEKCATCPLYQTLGMRCDDDSKSPWREWVDRHDPEPMIRALRKTLKHAQEARQKRAATRKAARATQTAVKRVPSRRNARSAS